ncbi:hypothetical protein M9458_036281, partial [Cirrhinus mrigala]
CTEPDNDKECAACQHYFHEDRCVEACPPGTYKFEGWRCITMDMCARVHLPSESVCQTAHPDSPGMRLKGMPSELDVGVPH